MGKKYTFNDLVAASSVPGVLRWKLEFDNGYGASVVYIYKFINLFDVDPNNSFELAVTKGGKVDVSTDIAADVVQHLNMEEVAAYLNMIAALPNKGEEQ